MTLREQQIANLAKARAAGMPRAKKELTPIKAIRAHCMECSGGSFKAVKYCTLDGVNSTPVCPLWPFRFGKRPKSVRKSMGDKWLDPEQMPDANEDIDSLP